MREILYYYYIIEYETEVFDLENKYYYYSDDKSLFFHDIKGKQIWVLEIKENESKKF